MKLLICAEDYNLAKLFKKSLEKYHYTIDIVKNGQEAQEHVREIPYDALIIDHMLSGYEESVLVEKFRSMGVTVPIIVFGNNEDSASRIKALEQGADEYITKPICLAEFIAKLKALLRRSSFYVPRELKVGNLNLDCTGYVLYTDSGSFDMNNKEFQITEYLMRNKGKTFSTEELMARFWGWDCDSTINVVWTNISNIRRKLKALKANVIIKSVRGVGYKMEEC